MIVRKIVLFLGLIFMSSNQASVNAGEIGTADIITAATDALDNCLDYCVQGVCIAVICTPFGCSTDESPWISHNTPDIVVSAYKDPGEITWSDMESVLSSSAKSVGNAQLKLPIFGGGSPYTGRHQPKRNNNDIIKKPFSNLHFKEVSVIGSPAAEIVKNIQGICESEVTTFQPYYQSEYDSFEWRWGLLEKFYPSTWVPGLREISTTFGTTWGGVHPRVGFIKSEHPARAASVAAQRAIDIATRSNQAHIYTQLPNPESDEALDDWQMIHPVVEKSCHAFGSPTDYIFNTTERLEKFAFNYWSEVECCPYATGVVVAKIPANECN